MLFRIFCSGFCLLIVAAAQSAADTAAGFTTNYEYVADGCGSKGRAYSAAEYAKATAEATAHLAHLNKLQKKTGQYGAKIKEVQAAKGQIQRCEAEQEFNLNIRRNIPCSDIVREYWAHAAKGSDLQDRGLVTEADRKAARNKFQDPVYQCAKKRIQKCIDPNNNKEVMEAVELLELAQHLKVIGSYASDKGVGGLIASINPLQERPSFCTDTDYACDPATDPAVCDYYRTRIHDAMETFISRFRG